MKKYVQIVWIISFAILFVLPYPLYSLMGNVVDTTNYENRELAVKPELNLLDLTSYPTAYDSYINDNIPFRNELVSLNSILNMRIYKKSPTERVIIGDDGWLFYNGAAAGDGDPVADLQGSNLLAQEELAALKQNLIDQRDSLKEKGIDLVVFFCPNKETIYSEKMPGQYGSATELSRTQQIVDYIEDEIRVVYPIEEIKKEKDKNPEISLYYKLDTHWNNLGAYIGAKEVLRELGYNMPNLNEYSLSQTNTSGDLAAMMNLSRYLKYDINYSIDGLMDHTEEIEWANGIGRCRSIIDTDKKIMLVGDSFSRASGPIIATQFSELLFTHRNNYTEEMLNEFHPDVVVLEFVERYSNGCSSIALFN